MGYRPSDDWVRGNVLALHHGSRGRRGSDTPESDPEAEGVIFVVEGTLTLIIEGEQHVMNAGGFALLPAGCNWTLRNHAGREARFHWLRKAYEVAPRIDAPEPFVTSDPEVSPIEMSGTEGRWATARFVDPIDMRHNMHVTVVTFRPGGVIPFLETHVMEHGLYVLEGKAVYRLDQDWVEVEPGDYMRLRAFSPQACYAGGPGPFRYLLYKDVNRQMQLRLSKR